MMIRAHSGVSGANLEHGCAPNGIQLQLTASNGSIFAGKDAYAAEAAANEARDIAARLALAQDMAENSGQVPDESKVSPFGTDCDRLHVRQRTLTAHQPDRR
jgi:hypothetical protein